MASAIVRGMLNRKVAAAEAIGCTCGADPSGETLARETGITYHAEVNALVQDADTVILACKPQQFAEIAASIGEQRLVISILAGMPLKKLADKFTGARNLVRSMPNTPGQIGAGITAYVAQHPLSESDQATTHDILGALGKVLAVDEAHMDAVTAISGSGPAYVFEFTAALAEAGVALGLDREIATELARQTIVGAGSLMEATGTDAETLRNQVTSPGGTTQAALETFAKDDLRGVVARATAAAKARSLELGAD